MPALAPEIIHEAQLRRSDARQPVAGDLPERGTDQRRRRLEPLRAATRDRHRGRQHAARQLAQRDAAVRVVEGVDVDLGGRRPRDARHPADDRERQQQRDQGRQRGQRPGQRRERVQRAVLDQQRGAGHACAGRRADHGGDHHLHQHAADERRPRAYRGSSLRCLLPPSPVRPRPAAQHASDDGVRCIGRSPRCD